MIHGAKKIIIIGGNAAGPAAAAKAKRVNPQAEVLLFEAGEFISTGTCELPYLISGEIDDYRKIVFFNPESFHKSKGVKVFTNNVVEEINRREKYINVRDNTSSILKKYEYDSLVLATGSKARLPQRFSTLPQNAFSLKSVSDYLKIKNALDTRNLKNVIIFGAGYIGLEAADAFLKSGKNVTLLEKENLPLPGYEYEIRNLVKELILNSGINFIPNYDSPKLNMSGDIIESVTAEGRIIGSDLVLFTIGVEPNNSLALSCGLKLGSQGGIEVDNYLRTSDTSIYAAGDVAETTEFITGKKFYLPYATLAHSQGHTAGANAAGERQKVDSVIRNVAVKFFDNVFSHVGLTSDEAMSNGINAISVSAVVPNIIKVMPGSRNVFGKIIFDKYSGKVLGAAFLGSNEVTGYADLISLLISKRGKLEDLNRMSYNYTPPSSPFVNILSVLSRKTGENHK